MELDRTFRFGVKLKKQHEIVLLSEVHVYDCTLLLIHLTCHY